MAHRKAKTHPKAKAARISYQGSPSGFTLFRHQLYDVSAREVFSVLREKMKVRLWVRDREIVQRIQAAGSLEELLDLAGQATGLGEDAWSARMQEYGSEALAAIGDRLRHSASIRDENERDIFYDRLIGELRWRGKNGARVLAECMDGLDRYARGLACVVMGLTGLEEAADLIWDTYQAGLSSRQQWEFIGPLWGLVDLKDARLQGALVEQLAGGRWFYELFGFISLRSQDEAVIPLMSAFTTAPAELRIQPFMALVSVVHRVGKERAADLLEALADTDEEREIGRGLLDKLYSVSPREAENHFEAFYAGMSSKSVGGILDEIG